MYPVQKCCTSKAFQVLITTQNIKILHALLFSILLCLDSLEFIQCFLHLFLTPIIGAVPEVPPKFIMLVIS